MFISAVEAMQILEYYKYLLIFPIAVIEGPIISVISGFLVFLGYLNAYLAFVVLVGADVLGDCIYYTIGTYWRRWAWVKKYANLLGYSEASELFLEEHFKKHTAKTLLIAKASHGLGAAVQVAAGIAHMDFKKFLWYSFIGTLVKSFILMTIGFYLGRSYIKIDEYFHSIAFFTVGTVLITSVSYIIVTRYANQYLSKK